MAKKCDMSFLHLLPADENDKDGINEILTTFQKYQVFVGDDEKRIYNKQGVIGDQLSVERGANAQFNLVNGFTPQERFDDIHFEIADFHSEMKFMQLCMDHFYKSGCLDRCTLGSDKVIINRRNVVTEVKKNYAATKKFLGLSLESRVLAATLTVLGIERMDENPDESVVPHGLSNLGKPERKRFLSDLAAKVVDEFILQKKTFAHVLQVKEDLEEERLSLVTTSDGKLRCQEPSCKKTFRFNGKRKRDHEEKAHGIVKAKAVLSIDNNDDDMYNYQCSLLEYLMLLKNFQDGVSEGDGARILRCWKIFLLYLKADGPSSRKYCLEGLYLLFQVNCLLPARESYRLIWNRSVKKKSGLGGNIPIDLAMEHYIRIVKLLKRKLGPNQTNENTLQRYMKALGFTKNLLEDFDDYTGIIQRSGRHYKRSDSNDKAKIVEELMNSKALVPQPKRKYAVYKNIKPSMLADFNFHHFYDWINQHKDDTVKKRKAR
ncbi:uncharacterized protein LOC114515642 [Dendronephthya gigantea]|uniref:uncharacterized protein LOC114515642 n=1 Tax=Dendronephthya gigantea TaxID=151771 RepID=UPI00106C993F|nr:uncharacterized protein LOC114515642 [Dendronephthya gigantea]